MMDAIETFTNGLGLAINPGERMRIGNLVVELSALEGGAISVTIMSNSSLPGVKVESVPNRTPTLTNPFIVIGRKTLPVASVEFSIDSVVVDNEAIRKATYGDN